ncbi:PREDICTED: pentatricopeptide repeat-containing protein At4g17616 [Tarenaya hassleriana]|uniref:pentatricopeptide repeat-containing protein At4g17616 n=1 Tax=Tarenaya hassleriana TaxID=28532 RepID=UPI00053C815D|nr:PREDICTED: pentatricopeptide repeat-containing protein At4g17616 [Tarenaya hassleriana]
MVRCNKYLDFRKIRSLEFLAVAIIRRNTSSPGNFGGLIQRKGFAGTYVLLDLLRNDTRFLSTSVHSPSLSWEASSQEVLCKKLETALKNHCIDDAWGMFRDFKRLYGLPDKSMLNRFVTVLSYSNDSGYLRKACNLVSLTMKQNRGLIHSDVLTRLLMSLSRAQLPEPACNILRAMLEMSYTPPVEVSRLVVMHMVKSKVGTCLASNYLVQLCDDVVDLDGRKKLSGRNVVKPDTLIFNLVLGACVRFGFSLKGQELVELMAKTGIIADAYTIVIISRLYEMNGMRDELKKFKEHIDQVPALLLSHYRHFYDNLLSLEFKFDDIDSAGRLVLDVCKTKDFLSVQSLRVDSEKPRALPVGSDHIRSGLKIQISPELLQRDLSLQMEMETEFVDYVNAKLVITKKALAKLVYGYKKHGSVSQLSKLLLLLGGSKLCADVFDACVSLCWLDIAHDILDDMESAGHPMGLPSYMKLLSGYYEQKMLNNAEALLRQMKKAGLVTVQSIEMVGLPETKGEDTKDSELCALLVQEMESEKEMTDPQTLYELNSSLYFFCKAKMKGDSLRNFRKIQRMKIPPNLQTFWILIDMYSSLGMYREITVVWGDIKRNMESRGLRVTQDLLEKLVMNFLKGGYFERVMEVINYMKRSGLYTDLNMYKTEYLKLHKKLYISIRASEAETDAQAQRLLHVQNFKKLVGLA